MASVMYCVVVLYNKKISEITSLNNFLSLKGLKVIIMDNSNETISRDNIAYAEGKDEFIYVNNRGNIGLSKSYNKAIDMIKDGDFWVMISDDDTLFSLDYLNNVYQYVNNDPECDLVTGLITSNGQVSSPLKSNGVFKGKADAVTEYGIHENIYPINSGIVIHSNILKEVRFNEELFVDMIDYCFMEDLITKGLNCFMIVEGDIKQEFSFTEKVNIESVKNRFKIFKKDFTNYCRIQNKSFIYK